VTNAQYLVLSYFAVGAACLLLALATYALLRRSLADLNRAVPGDRLDLLFRRIFPLGIILPALAGFFSVTFRSCGKDTYEKIIADRSYLVAKNQEQLGTSFMCVALVLLIWALLVSVGFVTLGKQSKEHG
jgi:hypothetical protein